MSLVLVIQVPTGGENTEESMRDEFGPDEDNPYDGGDEISLYRIKTRDRASTFIGMNDDGRPY